MRPVSENSLEELIRTRIDREEGISFAAFMEQCLYQPGQGYYMSDRERIGKAGDFFTSSSVHALFGRLIARQFGQMDELLGAGPFQVVEQGAGEGYLALDILDAIAEEMPEFYERLVYRIVERSPENRRRQAEKLSAHADRVQWGDDDWAIDGGCFLSNELIDAFPVHVLEKHDGALREVYVVNRPDGGFDEELREPPAPTLANYFDWLGTGPVEGNRAEANLVAPDWMRRVGRQIERGFALTVDYGYPAQELYAMHRRSGTLMCYHRHQADENPYEKVGEKDITAHVDFTALQLAGEEVGLRTLWFGEQYRFLMSLGFVEELMRLEAETTDENEARALRLTLKNLIMPEAGMGETFKVLVQGKNVGQPQLLCARALQDLPFPMGGI
jgi:SAM-dependent MidA family methyltransferase